MLCNAIHIIFFKNKTERLIVKGILYCVILTTVLNCVEKKLQLLLYIWGESGVGKSWVVNAIELGFSLLSCRANLVLAALTGAVASNIEGNTIYICLGISIRNNQERTNKVSSIWIQRYTLIINEVSKVVLDILSNITK